MIIDHWQSKEDFATEVNDEKDVNEIESSPEEDKLEGNIDSKDNAKD